MKIPWMGRHALGLVLSGLVSLFSPVVPSAQQPREPARGYRLKQTISVQDADSDLRGWSFSLWQQSKQDHSLPILPAKLCASRGNTSSRDPELCYEASAGNDAFPSDANAERIALRDRPPLREAIFFRARKSAGGSGRGQFLALLVPEKGSESLRDLLPQIILSNQGEYRFWSEPRLFPYRLLTVAEFKTHHRESHFAAHHYNIRTFGYCAGRGSYLVVDAYNTLKKYPSFDDVDKIQVIGPEHTVIMRRLRRLKEPLENCSAELPAAR